MYTYSTARRIGWRMPKLYMKASTAENNVANQQANFYQTLANDYSTQFKNQGNILSAISAAWSPILSAGINQQGYSPAELDALDTNVLDTNSQAYQNAQRATNAAIDSRGGGNEFLPSGAADQIDSQLADQAAQSTALGLQNNTINDYNTGRQNFLNASAALSGNAALYSPTSYAGSANNAGSAAFNSANTINQQNDTFGAIAGALGGIAGDALGGPIGGAIASKL